MLAMIREKPCGSELAPRSLLDREGGKTHIQSVMATITVIITPHSAPFHNATASVVRAAIHVGLSAELD